MNEELTGYPSIDKPWLKYYSKEAINAPLPECTIYEYLWENNKDHLDDIAIIYFNRKITYGELFRNINKTASALVAVGVKKVRLSPWQCRAYLRYCMLSMLLIKSAQSLI